MPNPPEGMRTCPTRADGESVLFAHRITPATCQERQRAHYHKCPTCVHANARSVPGASEEAVKAALIPTRRVGIR